MVMGRRHAVVEEVASQVNGVAAVGDAAVVAYMAVLSR